MKRMLAWILAAIFVFLGIGLACNAPVQFNSQAQALQQTAQALSIQLTQQAERQSTEAAATDTETPVPPSATPEPPTATSTIAHVQFPGEPPSSSYTLTDFNSQPYAAEHRTLGDDFTRNRYERPFTSQVMDYQPYLDITKGQMAFSDPFFYTTIYLEGALPEAMTTTYAVELDLDYDGRGDWFIRGFLPPSSDWTTNGVQVFQDSNSDVGGTRPLNPDTPNPDWNGFDQEVFNAGVGSDPDAAWIRRDPSDTSRIQLAFKQSLIGKNQFVWGCWSDEGVQEPGWLDYHDHFTLADAGHPSTNSADYPLKQMFSLDNTCRAPYGFKPIQAIPGLCTQPATPTAVHPTKTACEEPPNGCPVFGAFATHWNKKTCQCEPPEPQCTEPPNGCPVTAPFVWDPVACKCVLK